LGVLEFGLEVSVEGLVRTWESWREYRISRLEELRKPGRGLERDIRVACGALEWTVLDLAMRLACTELESPVLSLLSELLAQSWNQRF